MPLNASTQNTISPNLIYASQVEQPAMETLRLIRTQTAALTAKTANAANYVQGVFSEEALQYLFKVLQFADQALRQEIETALVDAAQSPFTPIKVVPMLLNALLSEHGAVKATAAMALIRIGQPVGPALKRFHERHIENNNARWVLEYVMGELYIKPSKAADKKKTDKTEKAPEWSPSRETQRATQPVSLVS